MARSKALLEVDEREVESSEDKKNISILAGRIGAKLETFELEEGTTLLELKAKLSAKTFEVRVNKEKMSDSYVLKDGDLVVILPDAVVGG